MLEFSASPFQAIPCLDPHPHPSSDSAGEVVVLPAVAGVLERRLFMSDMAFHFGHVVVDPGTRSMHLTIYGYSIFGGGDTSEPIFHYVVQ